MPTPEEKERLFKIKVHLLEFINFLIEKRSVIEGWDTELAFTTEDVNKFYKNKEYNETDLSQITSCLRILKNSMDHLKNGQDNGPIITDYKIENNSSIKVSGANTDKLKRVMKLTRKFLYGSKEKSLFSIKRNTLYYQDMPGDKLIFKDGDIIVLKKFIKTFPHILKYENIIDDEFENHKPTHNYITALAKKIKREFELYEKKIFENYKNRGYTLLL